MGDPSEQSDGVLPMSVGESRRAHGATMLTSFVIAICAGMLVAALMSAIVVWQTGPTSSILTLAYWFFSLAFALPMGLVVGGIGFAAGVGAQRASRAVARGRFANALVGALASVAIGCIASVLIWQFAYPGLGVLALIGSTAALLGGGAMFCWLSRS